VRNVVEDPNAVAHVRAQLWDRAWHWSQKAAISGSETQARVFKPQIVQQNAAYGRK